MASTSTVNNHPNQTATQLKPPQHHHHQNHHNSFGMMQSSSSSPSIQGIYYQLRGKDSGAAAYDLGELDQALFLYLNGQPDPTAGSSSSSVQHQRQNYSSSSGLGMRPPTLNIFPSQPMHVNPSSSNSKASMELVSPEISSGSKRASSSMELANPRKQVPSCATHQPPKPVIKRGSNQQRKGRPTSSSEQEEGPKTPDPKTLRRLAQNREAARKSRLRKKVYVQQLESSRIRLNQLEQELQRARAQGMFLGGGEHGLPVAMNSISSEGAMFDVEYGRWLEEQQRLVCELRGGVEEHIPENELRMLVENFLAQYDHVMNLKSLIAKADVFHLISGIWKTPAERCFMWIGGFKPSQLIKIFVSQIEPLTEQQIMDICGLQQCMQEAEDNLSQGLEALNQSLLNTITSDSLSHSPNMPNYMGQMAVAINKLSTLEDFVRQADSLRQQTIRRLHQILTTRQAARCFLAIAEYFHRLRALSSLWMARPRQE